MQQYLKTLKQTTSEQYVGQFETQELLKKLGMHKLNELLVEPKALSKILLQESPFKLDDVLRWAHIEFNGQGLIDKLTSIFGQCETIQHFQNRYNLKVSRQSNSIGFVFGVMESLKSEFNISEYSATQTTLEQIFNMFARQKGVGNRHESLLDKKHQ